MEGTQREIVLYRSRRGTVPYQLWFDSIADQRTRQVIVQRLTRHELGHSGDCKSVGDGVFELRIHFGPGYRIYFGQEGKKLIILLSAGDKSTQKKDIRKAKIYWKDYQWSVGQKQDRTVHYISPREAQRS